MAALNVNTLLNEAKCYACYDPVSVPRLAKLALLSRISLQAYSTFVTSWTPGANRTDFNGSVGELITVGAQPIVVSQLGLYIVSGGTHVHTISIWTNACVLVASVNIDFTGKAGATYAAITPVTLAAATSYRLSLSVVFGEDPWTNNLTSVMTTTSVASVFGPVFGVGVACPSGNGGAGAPYVGLDFRYTSP